MVCWGGPGGARKPFIIDTDTGQRQVREAHVFFCKIARKIAEPLETGNRRKYNGSNIAISLCRVTCCVRMTGQKSELTRYLDLIGISDLPPLTNPFDPGYEISTVLGHFEQTAHLMASYKISMATWMIAAEHVTAAKITAAKQYGVPVVTGGGPFEIAVAQDRLPEYLDLCAFLGVDRIESGNGFTTLTLDPQGVVEMAKDRGLAVQFEVGNKHAGPFDREAIGEAIEQAAEWLGVGAECVVIEARESAKNIGLFNNDSSLNLAYADRLVTDLGLSQLIFEAPTKASQFALLDHFGPEVQLGNVRLEEILRVETYRRGLHSDAFAVPALRPADPGDGLVRAKRETRG
jgi:phosphosulfolactate synthase